MSEKMYERFDFSNVDELLKIRERLPAPTVTNVGQVREIAGQFVNAKDFAMIHSGIRIWQVASDVYSLLPNSELITTIAGQLSELGLDDVRGRVKTWNYGGRIWIECIEPKDYEPLPGDRYNRGFWFKNSYDGSNSLGAGFYAFRQVCSNGMHAWVRELLVRQIHLGRVVLSQWLQETIEKMRGQQAEFERMIQRAAQVRVEDDLAAVMERLDVGPIVQKKIENRIHASDGLTAYDLVNAITAYATHDLAEKPLSQENYGRLAQRILVAPEIVVK